MSSPPLVSFSTPQILTTDTSGGPFTIAITGNGEVIAVRSYGNHLKQFQYFTGIASAEGTIDWQGSYTYEVEHAGPTCVVSMNVIGDIVLVWEYQKLLYY